jgi:hypothetical protein
MLPRSLSVAESRCYEKEKCLEIIVVFHSEGRQLTKSFVVQKRSIVFMLKNLKPIALSFAAAALLVSLPLRGLFTAQAQTSSGSSEQSALLQDEQNTIDVIGTYGPSVVARR